MTSQSSEKWAIKYVQPNRLTGMFTSYVPSSGILSLLLARAWMMPTVPQAFPTVCFMKNKSLLSSSSPILSDSDYSSVRKRKNLKAELSSKHKLKSDNWSHTFSEIGYSSMTAATGFGTIIKRSGSSPNMSWNPQSVDAPRFSIYLFITYKQQVQ